METGGAQAVQWRRIANGGRSNLDQRMRGWTKLPQRSISCGGKKVTSAAHGGGKPGERHTRRGRRSTHGGKRGASNRNSMGRSAKQKEQNREKSKRALHPKAAKNEKDEEDNQQLLLMAPNVHGLRKARKIEASGSFTAGPPPRPDVCIITETHPSDDDTHRAKLGTNEKTAQSCGKP